MNQFTKAELEGRALFKEILDQKGVTESHPSDDEFDTLDYYYTSSQQLSVGVEIKKRDQKYLNYPTHFLEVKKFKAIYQRLNNGEFDRALYVNFFGDNVAYIYNFQTIIKGIKDQTITVSYTHCNRTTAINTGKVDKKIIELPLSLGIRLEKKEDKWIRIK